ncbi:MAG: M20/M25/M40 family metallo-hydrolase [Candidatus Gastranaerophilaceae bacterium]
MLINNLNQNKLLKIFRSLVEIPSPSLCEDNLINWIKDFCKKNNVAFELDNYKNVFLKVGAKNPQKRPILLSAHMDVVGDFSPVNIKVEGDFIKTDGKRTLGADDKVGVACALLLASELSQQSDEFTSHGGLEIVFTRDEEHGMSGIKHVDFKKINSKYILVLDADKLGQLLTSGASYTKGVLKISTTYGGHSGLDIGDKNRLNAAKLISDLVSKIPQGVFYENETGTITSINLGTIIGGDIQNTAAKIVSDKIESNNYLDYFIKNSVTNVINTQAQASYSVRSADAEKETELKQLIKNEVVEFNKKYKGLAKAEIIFSEHLPPFEKSSDDLIEKIHALACQKAGVTQEISSFHAGAETHVYAQNKNASGEKFLPCLVGMADVFNMHSSSEKVDYKTMLKGYEVLKQMFIEFNQL